MLDAEGEALVVDDQSKVRGLVAMGGGDDSYAELRFVFDEEERLRLIFMGYANVAGSVSEHLLVLDQSRHVLVCDNLVDRAGLAVDPCVDEDPPPKLDPAVQRAIGTKAHEPRNALRERLLAIDPREEFALCATPL